MNNLARDPALPDDYDEIVSKEPAPEPALAKEPEIKVAPEPENKDDQAKDEKEPEQKTEEQPHGFNDDPRWQQLYRRAKENERLALEKDGVIQEQTKYISELSEAVQKINSKIDSTFDQVSENNRPDPIEDPDKFEQWAIEKGRREALKEVDKQLSENKKPEVKAEPQDTENDYTARVLAQQERVAEMVELQGGPNYNEVVTKYKHEMLKDPKTRAEFFESPNMPLYAYKYGLKRMEANKTEKTTVEQQAYVEGGTAPINTSSTSQLSEAEKMTAKKLGVSEKVYLKNKIALQAMRGQ